MNHTKYSALVSLRPTSKWNWVDSDYADLNWISSDTKPTEAEIDADSDLKVKFSAFYNSIKAVKDANPKP